jgi:integrase
MGRQTGCIFRNNNGTRWFARWRENVVENGEIKRKMRFRDLAPVNDTYRTEKDVQPLLDEILAPINSGKARPESTMSVFDYAEGCWLPWVRDNCKPSTIAGYETYWQSYLAPRLQKISLRDFRTVDAANLLADLHRSYGHGREMLKKSKAILSGIFTLARNLGALDKPNPIPGAMIPKKAAASSDLHATSPDEVVAILDALGNAKPENDKEISREHRLKARAAVALQFFAGLRPGEARGARWEDYDGKRIAVCQSVWHTYITTPKTEESAKPVPVIEPLAGILADLKQADGNPSSGPILRGPSGKPLNLENLSKRVVAPLLKAKKVEWHGWYSLRRGVATTIKSMSKDSLAAKGLLRHSSVTTTERHYIKDVPENTLSAMNQLEKLFNECSTVKN